VVAAAAAGDHRNGDGRRHRHGGDTHEQAAALHAASLCVAACSPPTW
jgi:hypothetical protein